MTSSTRIAGVATLVALAMVGAACGSSNAASKTITEHTVTVVEQPAPTTETVTTAPATTDPTSDPRVVPSVVGKRLDVAELKLHANGIRYKEIGGGVFGIIVRSNWQVCQQLPKAGSVTNARIKLVVDRPGNCTSVSGGAEKTIPDLVGERLDLAETQLDEMGIAYKEIGGGLFGIVVTSNWVVCTTDPPAGSKGEKVDLVVDRPGNC